MSAVSVAEFRDGMARLGAAVTIVATDGPAGTHAITASAVCSVTDAPPTLLVCVNRASSAHDIILANGALSVNVLGPGYEDLAARLGRPGLAPAERLQGEEWTRWPSGAPRLAGAVVAFDCRLVGRQSVGTHSVLFGEVSSVAMSAPGCGLIYFERRYHRLEPAVPPSSRAL